MAAPEFIGKNLLQKLHIGKENDSYQIPHRFSLRLTKLRQLRIHLQENKIRLMERRKCEENKKNIMKEVHMKRNSPMPMTPTPKKSSKELVELLKNRKFANQTNILPQDHFIERKTFFPVAKDRIKELRSLGMSWDQVQSEMHVQFINPIKNKSDAKLKKNILQEHIESAKVEEKELVPVKPTRKQIPSSPPKMNRKELKYVYSTK